MGILIEVIKLMKERRNVVAFTGAGISVESDIPAFHGVQDLWEKHDPVEYADIASSLMKEPAKV